MSIHDIRYRHRCSTHSFHSNIHDQHGNGFYAIPSVHPLACFAGVTQHTRSHPNVRAVCTHLLFAQVARVCESVWCTSPIHMMAAQMVGRQTQTKQCAMYVYIPMHASHVWHWSQIQTARLNPLRIGFFGFNFRCMNAVSPPPSPAEPSRKIHQIRIPISAFVY